MSRSLMVGSFLKLQHGQFNRQWLRDSGEEKAVNKKRRSCMLGRDHSRLSVASSLWWYILSKENELNSTQRNHILGKTSSAWDLLAHISGKLNHINGAGRQAGTVPEQSGQNERKITRKRGIPLAWIIATQHFDQLCDNFHAIWQLSAGWNGEKQWFRSFLGTWKLSGYLSLIPMCLKAATYNWGQKIQQNADTAIRQKLTWPRLDLNCWAAPDVLLHLRHALPGRLVRVVRGTNCDLVLNASLALQVIPALPVCRGKEEGDDSRVKA